MRGGFVSFPKFNDRDILLDAIRGESRAVEIMTGLAMRTFLFESDKVIGGAADSLVTEYLFKAPTKLKINKAEFLVERSNSGDGNAPTLNVKRGNKLVATVDVSNTTSVAQISTLTPSDVEIGDCFIVVINGTVISYKATAATVKNVVDGLVEAINNSSEGENNVAAENTDDEYVSITSQTAGTPFTITANTTNAQGIPDQTMAVTTPTPNVTLINAVAQISHLTPDNVEIDDTFITHINGVDIEFTATVATAANVCTGLALAINNSIQGSVVTADGSNGIYIVVTAVSAGVAFTIDGGAIDGGGTDNQSLLASTPTPNVPRREAVAQISELTPVNVEIGDTFTTVINGEEISYQATENTISNVTGGLADGIVASGQNGTVYANAFSDRLVVGARTAGVAFTIHASTINLPTGADTQQLLIDTPTPNVAGAPAPSPGDVVNIPLYEILNNRIVREGTVISLEIDTPDESIDIALSGRLRLEWMSAD